MPSYNVLVLTNLYPGGTIPWRGAFVRNQVDSLRRAGHTVEVLVIDGARSRWEYASCLYRLRRKTAAGRFDLVHAHYGLTGLVGATQRRLPLVLTHLGSDLLWTKHRTLSRLAGRMAACNVVMSRKMADLLGQRNVCVLPNGTDLGCFVPVPPIEARRRLGWPEEEFIAIFPNDPRRPVKNFPLAEEAVAAARARGAALRLLPFYGHTQEEFNLALNGADAAVLTSHWEGSPNSVRESLAVGLPVVSVPAGDAREMLDGLEYCRICPPDPLSLGAALSELVDLRGRSIAPLRHGGRARVEPFSVERVAAKLTRLYECVLAGERDGSRIQSEIDRIASAPAAGV